MDHHESDSGELMMKWKWILITFFCCIEASTLSATAAPESEVEPESDGASVASSVTEMDARKIRFINPHYAFTTAITVPQPLTLGMQVNWDSLPKWEVFFEGGWFRYPLSASSRQFNDYSVMAGFRFHPFQNWFYIGGELGYHHLGITVDISNIKTDGQSLASTARLDINALFLGVFVGGEWSLSKSVALAVDLGLQIGVIHGGGIEIKPDPNDPNPGDLSVDAERVMDRISGIPLPQIALMRFIWRL